MITDYPTIKISQLPTNASPLSTDVLPEVSGGVTQKINPGALSADWKTLSVTPNSIVYNGQRSYTLIFPAVDYTSLFNAGTRFQTTRSTAAPTQCATFNGTTQYYSKSSPNKLTFTDDFVVGTWIKLTSYPTVAGAGTIKSRYDGTSGFRFDIEGSGLVRLIGYNAGSTNYSLISSYQSVPLNKWVHVTAQLDMSAFTNTSTTSYIMLDGVDVACSVSRVGTNPTSLIQAGNLQIGAANSTLFFPGKIAQAFIAPKITQANVRTLITQGITAALITTHSIYSAWSFNGVATDLNTTTPNDLTANGGVASTTADSPFGTQASGLINSLLDYAIVQTTLFSTDTTVVVQVPEGCTLPTSGGIASVSYSGVKAPYGFPTDRGRWTIQTIVLTNISAPAGSANTVYPFGSVNLNIAIGAWAVRGMLQLQVNPNGTAVSAWAALSTSTSAMTDHRLTYREYQNGLSGGSLRLFKTAIMQNLTVASPTPYYPITISDVALNGVSVLRGLSTTNQYESSIIEAENAYL